jgi:sulfhydrogenase subunit alpha
LIESIHLEDHDFHVYVKPGTGGSVTEAPRGLLFHWYKINSKGIVEQANIVTPTSHNFQNIEKDLEKLVSQNKDKERNEIQLLCEQLVRAYDPCFSCSVH